jgi:hypothetical protein
MTFVQCPCTVKNWINNDRIIGLNLNFAHISAIKHARKGQNFIIFFKGDFRHIFGWYLS